MDGESAGSFVFEMKERKGGGDLVSDCKMRVCGIFLESLKSDAGRLMLRIKQIRER